LAENDLLNKNLIILVMDDFLIISLNFIFFFDTR
jgi:hypothetical protein